MVAIIVFVPQWGWSLRAMFSPSVHENTQDLVAEEESLKAQLAQYQVVAEQLPNSLPNYARAMVYSRYPTNFRNELLIDAGAHEGISVGKAVVIQAATSSYVLIGRIQSVSNDMAVVQTVFDPAFKMPVRVGSHGYDGLLIGGVSPRVASILKKVAVQAGDIVVSADTVLPYGLPVAEVSNVAISSDNLFQDASLNFAYDINGVQTVLIAK
jgi:cell shape-determining protein MreC